MQSAHDRRDFIKKGLLLGGAAGLLTAGLAPIAAAQTVGKAVRRPDRYADSYIFERKLFTWPGNKTLAVWVAPNVEVWNFDSPVGVGVSPNFGNIVPDIINYGWREYGMRVGLWRLADVLDAPVDRPVILETTALGAAWLAGSKAGVWPGMAEFAASWARDAQFKRRAQLRGVRGASQGRRGDEKTRMGIHGPWHDQQ